MPLLVELPLLLLALTAVVLAVVLRRALRDEAVLESLRIEVRRLGETQRAVAEARAVHAVVDPRSAPARGRRT